MKKILTFLLGLGVGVCAGAEKPTSYTLKLYAAGDAFGNSSLSPTSLSVGSGDIVFPILKAQVSRKGYNLVYGDDAGWVYRYGDVMPAYSEALWEEDYQAGRRVWNNDLFCGDNFGYHPTVYLCVKTTPKTYLVTLDRDGGTGGSKSVEAVYDAEMPRIFLPTREGYSFTGYWGDDSKIYYNADGSSARVWTRDEEEVTLTAVWTANVYRVAFDWQGGADGTAWVDATFAAPMPAITAPKRTGYAFNGYYSATDGRGDIYYNASAQSCVTWTNRASDMTLFACWAPCVYTISLDRAGGVGDVTTVKATYGAVLPTLTSLPTRTGYTFAGYFHDDKPYITASGIGTNAWDIASSEVTLVARWEANAYVVTLDANGGTGGQQEITAVYDQPMPGLTNLPTRAGYAFAGYVSAYDNQTYYNAQGKSSRVWKVAEGDFVLKAVWTPNTCQVQLDAQGGSGGTLTATATYNEYLSPQSIALPEREGYDFKGYYDDPTSGQCYYDASGYNRMLWTLDSATNATLYARWAAHTYTVSLDRAGGTGDATTLRATYGSMLPTLTTKPTKTGYAFQGYFYGDTLYISADGVGVRVWDVADNATLVARWQANGYTVRIDDNGGTGGTNAIEAVYGETLPDLASLPTRTGYTFDGYWSAYDGRQYYDAHGHGVCVWQDTAALSLKLEAHWQADTYTVLLDANGGAGGTPSVTATYDAALPTLHQLPSLEGRVFTGYYSALTNKGDCYYNAEGVGCKVWTVTNGATLYAHWDVGTYTVTLDSAPGSGGPKSVRATYGAVLPVLSAIPARTGYTFLGYFNDGDGTDGGTPYYTSGGIGTNTWLFTSSDVTLTAHWAANAYPVILDANGGTGGTNILATYDALLPQVAVPVRTGYRFTGYALDNVTYYNETGSGMCLWQIAVPNTVLKASWEPGQYVVTLDPQFNELEEEGAYGTARISATFGEWLDEHITLPERTGFTFKGYYAEPLGRGTCYYSASGKSLRTWDLAADTTLYAAWGGEKCTIRYVRNWDDGSVEEYVDESAVGTLYVFRGRNTYARPGYGIASWNTRADGTGSSYEPGASCSCPGSLTLYAQWSEDVYYVAFRANGGEGAMAQQAASRDSPYTLPKATFTRDGYGFAGWATNEPYTVENTFFLLDGQCVTNLNASFETTTLYAVWTGCTYEVTLDLGETGYLATDNAESNRVMQSVVVGDVWAKHLPSENDVLNTEPLTFTNWSWCADSKTNALPEFVPPLSSGVTNLVALWRSSGQSAIADALDAPDHDFICERGTAAGYWEVDEGLDAEKKLGKFMRSGVLPQVGMADEYTTSLKTEIPAQTVITFWWRLIAKPNYQHDNEEAGNFFYFEMNGGNVVMNALDEAKSGDYDWDELSWKTNDWREVKVTNSTLTSVSAAWVFSCVPIGEDQKTGGGTGWVDRVTFEPLSSPYPSVPTPKANLAYTGVEQDGFDPLADGVIFKSGQMKGTSARTYSATFVPYAKWSDETTEGQTVEWRIAPRDVADGEVSFDPIEDQKYTGAGPITPPITMTFNGRSDWKQNEDYELTYADNIDAGLAHVVVKGKGNFTGTTNLTFRIQKHTSILKPVVRAEGLVYTGAAQRGFEVYDGGLGVTGCPVATNAGVYEAVFALPANTDAAAFFWEDGSTASITNVWSIAPCAVTSANVSFGAIPDQAYTGAAREPAVTMVFNGAVCTQGVDYACAYADNTEPGTASVTVTGLGNFTNETTLAFQIYRTTAIAFPVAASNLVYTGAEQTGLAYAASLTCEGTVAATDAGAYAATFNLPADTPAERFTWEDGTTAPRLCVWSIAPCSVLSANVSFAPSPLPDQTYTGAALEPAVAMLFNGAPCAPDTDYALAYTDNVGLGTAHVTVTGRGNFTNETTLAFQIVAAPAPDPDPEPAAVSLAPPVALAELVYTGDAQTGFPPVDARVTAEGVLAATNAGAYTAVFTLPADTSETNYTWIGGGKAPVTNTWSIAPCPVAHEDVAFAAIPDQTHTGAALEPDVVMTFRDAPCVLGRDYTLAYTDNVAVGTARVTVTGQGNFTNETALSFAIVAAAEPDPERRVVPLARPEALAGLVYTGAEQVGTLPYDTRLAPSGTLVATNAGVYTAVFTLPADTAAAHYTWADGSVAPVTNVWSIAPCSVLSADVAFAPSPIPDQTHTGAALEPSVTMTFHGAPRALGADYTLAYSDNVAVGTAHITVTGLGNFTNETALSFAIVSAAEPDPERQVVPLARPEARAGLVYTGAEQVGVVSYDGRLAVSGTLAAVDAGAYTALFALPAETDTTRYTWADGTTAPVAVAWSIAPCSVLSANVSFAPSPIPDQTYTGAALEPAVAMLFNGAPCARGVDYALAYADNAAPGVARVTVTGLGNFTGTRDLAFTIVEEKQYDDPVLPLEKSYGAYCVGAKVRLELGEAFAGSQAKGLPSGLKFAAKAVAKDATFGAVAAGTVYGVPTKACTNTVTFTKKVDGATHAVSAAFAVAAAPTWAVGTFNGRFDDGSGSATLTVSAAGKISGKLVAGGKTWSFSANGYEPIEEDAALEALAIVATAKCAKATCAVQCAVTCDGASGVVAGETLEGAITLWRNAWKDAGATAKIAPYAGLYTVRLASDETGFGYLSLTLDKKGACKATGKLPDGTSASATLPLVWDDGVAAPMALWQAAPSAYKGGCVSGLLRWDAARAVAGEEIFWTSLAPAATAEYGVGFSRTLSASGAYYDKLFSLAAYYTNALAFTAEAPDLDVTTRTTDYAGTKKTTTTTRAETPAAVLDCWGTLTVALNATGKKLVVEAGSATRPVKDKETSTWLYEGANDAALTFGFTQATGIFKGTFTCWYDYVSATDYTKDPEKETLTHTSKKVSYEGVMVLGDDALGGFYLWNRTGVYTDEKTAKEKTYTYKESRPVVFE